MAIHARSTSISVSLPASPQSPDLHYRPPHPSIPAHIPFSQFAHQTSPPMADTHTIPLVSLPPSQDTEAPATVCGMPLKYVSLITLAVQNAALTIIMHHSRVSTPPSRSYSAASAVLLNELLKGGISLGIAVSRIEKLHHTQPTRKPSGHLVDGPMQVPTSPMSANYALGQWIYRFRRVGREVFSDDCWKLAIPAILYVVQNNLQYVAAANLDVATFTVTYQMKILTTAAFSVMLLRKKLGSTKWLALFFLAIGVGIVQLQAGAGSGTHTPPPNDSAAIMAQNDTLNLNDRGPHLAPPFEDPGVHSMQPLKGFLAVTAACFTSGLAGVYFEMVLKGSKADLWIRNVQLSLFSLLPALVPIVFSSHPTDSAGWFWDLFRNFGLWAWATVSVQVFGGLVTAVVIKYSDNILKGFATSLSIIISFLASVVLFNFRITPAFVFGATTVLLATIMYNKPTGKPATSSTNPDVRHGIPFPGSPIGPNSPILGQFSGKKRFTIAKSNSRSIASALGLVSSRPDTSNVHLDVQYRNYGQPFYTSSRTPSPPSSHPPTRPPSAPRPTLGTLDTEFFGRDGAQ
ncbi:nucleotide-sugar transporter-domain-containing protein [Gautieria morchelliformis]|nr:nucleotide-sugar transporter-domain-containing protein [Gautieria morchelliformis]